MAEYFHGILTVNPKTGGASNNWLALPALPTGMDPMRRVFLRSNGIIVEFGWCTAGQATENAGVMCTGGASTNAAFARDIGVVNYNRLTARSTDIGGNTAPLHVYSCSPTDHAPRGF